MKMKSIFYSLLTALTVLLCAMPVMADLAVPDTVSCVYDGITPDIVSAPGSVAASQLIEVASLENTNDSPGYIGVTQAFWQAVSTEDSRPGAKNVAGANTYQSVAVPSEVARLSNPLAFDT